MHAFRIGKPFGVELRIDWSWVFIFMLLTWNLASVFSRWHPDWRPMGALAISAAASLVFFCCILLHELAHALVAQRFGLRVRSITLFLFGGVSDIEREPPSAKAEFLIAIVGPATSIAIGALALFFTSLAMEPVTAPESAWAAVAQLGPFATLLAWLGPINIMIGVFNLIPGFPLDGGRVLRSILWSLTGDFRAATRWASAIGQLVGWIFIASGIAMTFGARLPLFGTGFISGLWLAFIGWFLHGAASQATTRLALDDALAGMTVAQLMRRRGPVASPGISIATLVHDHLVPGDDRGIPVARDGVLLGLVSISDVRTVRPAQWATTSVSSIMRRVDALSVAAPGEPLVRAFEQLVRDDIDQLPVVDGGELVGMLRRRDVTRWLELAWRPPASTARHAAGGSRPRPDEAGHPVSSAHHPA